MTEPRVTRSKARSLNLGDENANNKLVVNKNNQNESIKTVSVESQNTTMKLKNTFNNFSNTRNVSETTNYTVSVREPSGETENSGTSETKNCQQQVLESVNKMVVSGKTDMKVVRCFIEHVSGGDVVGLLAKLVTSTELDKIVDIVGATEVKQEALNDNVEVSDSQDNDETAAQVISDDENNEMVQNRIIDLDEENSDHGNDLPVISEVVGSHFEHSNDSNDDVEITRVVGEVLGGSTNTSQPSSQSTSRSTNNTSQSSSQSTSRHPQATGSSNNPEYQQLIQRYLAPVTPGTSLALDTAQMEAQMVQFLQQNGYTAENHQNGYTAGDQLMEMEDRMVHLLRQSGYAGYQEFLARSDLSTLATLLPSTSASSDFSTFSSSLPSTSSSDLPIQSSLPSTSTQSLSLPSSSSVAPRCSPRQSSLRRDASTLPRATLTPLGVSLTPVSGATPSQAPPPAHRRLEPALITPTGVSLTKITTKSSSSQDLSSRQLYSDPRSDLPPAARNDSVQTTARKDCGQTSARKDCPATRPPVIVSVESLSKSASVVANSLAKSSARRASVESLARSSGVVAKSLDKSSARRVKKGGAILRRVSQKEPKGLYSGGGKVTQRGEARKNSSEDDDFIVEEIEPERRNTNEKIRGKRVKHKRLNNIIEDSESESSDEEAGSEDTEDEDCVYEEAENEDMKRNRSPRAGSSRKRKNESSDSSESGQKFPRPRFKSTSEEEESYSSDDMTEKAKRSRAFKQFKQKRNSAKKSSEKGKARISARAVDSETDDGDVEKEDNSMKGVKRNIFNSPKKKKSKVKVANYIDSSDSDTDRDLDGFVVDTVDSESEDGSDSDDGNFVVNDNDDEVLDANNEFRKMMESLKRRSEKFQNLNEDYEYGAKGKQLGGYDESDEEPAENNYPSKLLEDLREVRNEASKDKENKHFEDAEDISNDDIIKEWEMYEVDQSTDLDGECICGQTGLRWMYFMRNKKIQNWEFYTRIVGSECINWFHRANPNSCMAVLSRVAKDGCILYYRKKLDSGKLLMTVGGNMLPGFLVENQKEHKEEYSLPISFTKLRSGTHRVDLKIKLPPASQGKGYQKARDTSGKILVVDQRYHVYLKPSIKPSKPAKCKKHFRRPCKCELKKEPAKVEFIILKIENLKDKEEKAARRPPTVKSFIK